MSAAVIVVARRDGLYRACVIVVLRALRTAPGGLPWIIVPPAEVLASAGEGERDITVTISLTVTEEATYEFTADAEVPAGVAVDAGALRDHLADNEEFWLDQLDPSGGSGSVCVNERSLDGASVVLEASSSTVTGRDAGSPPTNISGLRSGRFMRGTL
ncbi:hypothetical protein GCM10020367_58820 [Streptomyces sannanensis]|uniref:Uncharacterized protein n=1 Tax=Streptomyces sannanensis TaxID=285536 RepID=A0ABP6SL45_9ACTN